MTTESVKQEVEQYPKSAMEWLEDALGRFQITHCHASIREALKAMDTTEAATGGEVRCAAKDSEGLQCVLEHGHTRNSHVIHQVDDGASLWPSVPSTDYIRDFTAEQEKVAELESKLAALGERGTA